MKQYEVPTTPEPQTFSIALGGTFYSLGLEWHDQYYGGWFLTISEGDKALIKSIPLVAGLDLLAQYKHLGISGQLFVRSDSAPLEDPTMDNLGTGSHLYFVTS